MNQRLFKNLNFRYDTLIVFVLADAFSFLKGGHWRMFFVGSSKRGG